MIGGGGSEGGERVGDGPIGWEERSGGGCDGEAAEKGGRVHGGCEGGETEGD